MFDKAKRIVDITPSLRAPMPAYKILADGLTVTEERATAWFRIEPSSTQMATAKEMDAELAQAIALAQKGPTRPHVPHQDRVGAHHRRRVRHERGSVHRARRTRMDDRAHTSD